MLAWRGSVAHGCYESKSRNDDSVCDLDLMAIVVPPIDMYLGFDHWGSSGTKEVKVGPWDVVTYTLEKAMSMLAGGNPNILPLLYLEPEMYVHLHPLGQRLIECRGMFAGRHVRNSFTGFAISQMRNMAKVSFDGYEGQKRRELVERFGYDTKSAQHTIRLLRMALEYLQNGGTLNVMRQDAEELKAIKGGLWSRDRVETYAEKLLEDVDEAYYQSQLPNKPEKILINELLVNMLKHHFGIVGMEVDFGEVSADVL